jgi:hypothetical protein
VDTWPIIASLEAGFIKVSPFAQGILGAESVELVLIDIKNQVGDAVNDLVALTTQVTKLVSTAVISITVDPSNVNAPYRTIQSAINTLPKRLEKDVFIGLSATVASWAEDVTVEGFSGNGKITIDGISRTRIVTGQFAFRSNTNKVVLQNISIKGVDKGTFDAVFIVSNSHFVQLVNVLLDGQALTHYGLAIDSSFVAISNSTVTAAVQYAFICTFGTRLEVIDVIGSSPGGIRAEGAVHIGGSGKAPLGTTGGTNLTLVNGAMCSVAFVHSAT